MSNEELVKEAVKAMEFAYVPYSNFKVGAALLTDKDELYLGCNIENAAYGPTNCAERTAFFKAVSEGKRSFKKIAIVGGKDGKIEDICPPCGVCRQVMSEFCTGDFQIILSKDGESAKLYTLEDLLPERFGL